ncbi:protein phosphatase 1 regulatory subunit 3B-like isoform X2 [Octopus vulgaris]|uniref:Protein phosphatase 1 regulatory subunit 3B-like isoform X2 n=1 Tax=Octopus vulgaris TaxID=6645 RepID=A0AA36AK76_OCTVU|nr:protein phosphatase 1 regulatory subunit 3B-like isoform X2 [Octopus vulgaris]
MLGTDVHLLPNTGMQVDYTTYILSSSPPGTGLEFLNSNIFCEPLSSAERSFCAHAPLYIEQCMSRKASGDLKPIIIPDSPQSSSEPTSSEPTSPVNRSPLRPLSPGKQKKRVSFADCFGFALATIRVMTEPSDVPPLVRPEILSSLTKGSSASVTSIPPLKLCFTQPAADYVAFRDRVEKNFVSLENVILKDYQVTGTVKVKNVAFEKHVYIKCTFDSWSSSGEVDATYLNTNGCSRFDTFTFEMNVPTGFDIRKQILFAVAYRTDNKEYWDNNYGNDYLIVSSYANENPKPSIDFKCSDIDTTFASWNSMDTTVPYW